ncbi:hypothetical protein R1flu_026100 [Riccia fluitans]|uniref:Uncharacterized protein n=1 Tax=Riccia fluitans TaxID=41844 RepID=A0ABD1XF02_9MARC
MNGIRRRSSRQSDVPPEERPSQRQRHATSPNYELPHDEAMETIDRLVQDEETNSGDGAIVEKILTLQSMAIQPVVPTRLPRPHTINFEELSLLTRDELVIRQALKWIGRPSSSYTSTTLVLLALTEVDPGEPNLKPDWHNGTLKGASWFVRGKEDLHKAQGILADVAQREEALRVEHERL